MTETNLIKLAIDEANAQYFDAYAWREELTIPMWLRAGMPWSGVPDLTEPRHER